MSTENSTQEEWKLLEYHNIIPHKPRGKDVLKDPWRCGIQPQQTTWQIHLIWFLVFICCYCWCYEEEEGGDDDNDNFHHNGCSGKE